MKLNWYSPKIYFFSFVLFLSATLLASSTQITQLQNLAEVLSVLTQQNLKSITSAKSVVSKTPAMLTPPTTPIAATTVIGSWGATPTDAFLVTGNTLPSNMATLVDKRQNGVALACKGGLQFINVGLVGSAGTGGWGCGFAITGILQQLAQQGMYVVVTTVQQSGANTVVVSLTDVSGNVFATASAALSAGQGFSWINIGYNKNDTITSLNPNQVYVNWIQLTANTPIASWYQDQGSATAVSTPSIGGQVVPTTTTSVVSKTAAMLTPPTTPIAATSPLQWLNQPGYGSLPGDWPAVATSSVALGSWPVATIQNNKPVSCAKGLQTLYVDLMNQAGTGILTCQFTIQGNAILTSLAQQGMYIAVQVSNVNVAAGTSTITVSLTDQPGNVFAQAAANLASSVGATYVCAGFNINPFYNQLVTPIQPATQTCVNLVKISDSSRIYYQDQGSATTLTTPLLGGQVVQTTITSTKSVTPAMLTPPTTPAITRYGITPWGSPPTDAFVVTGNTLSSNMQTLVDSRQKGVPIACQGGLQFINVGLDGATNQGGWWCQFDIAALPIWQQLAQQGLYVVVTTSQQSGANTVVVSLTDVSGNVFATASTVLPAGQGFSWINIGYNKSTPVGHPLEPKQVYVNWIPLTANTPIASWYQDQGAATAASTPSIGGQVVPTPAKSVVSATPAMLTPPITPMSIGGFTSWGMATDAFVVTGNTLSSNMQTLVDSRQKGTPIACHGGLRFINVGLDGATNQGGWWCEFNIASSPMLQQLAQQGMYVVVTTLQQSGANTVVVSLTDVSGNVFAIASGALPAGQGFSWINIGYNKNNPTAANQLGTDQVYVNWIPLTANTPIASWYQDQGAATAASTPSIGGLVIPTTTISAKSVVSTTPAMLTPPVTPAPISGISAWGTTPTDAFVVTGNTLSSNMQTLIDKRQNGVALACQGGLKSINVGLVGASGVGGWGCECPIEGALQKLAQQGLYVVVTTLQQSGANTVVVSLTDVSGNVFATTSTVLPAGQGFSWINIGYNKNDTITSLKPDQVYVNWIPLTANTPIASWYQDQGAATAASTPSIGGQVVPTPATSI